MKDFYTLADLRDWQEEDPQFRLGVFGDPIAHSLSPRMQNAALAAYALKTRYAAFHILANELSEALSLLAVRGFVGVNLTLPHKIRAAGLVERVDPFARGVGAINTIRVENGELIGFNTDGPGFERAIREDFSVELRDLRVLIFGVGGGAGRAIAHQCARSVCQRLVLVNRDYGKARTLAEELRGEAIEWDAALKSQIENVDLIVNATPLGLRSSDPPILAAEDLAPRLLIYDTIYNPMETSLLRAATAAGARAANGLTMLLHQGALAFEIWFDRAAPIEAMRTGLTS